MSVVVNDKINWRLVCIMAVVICGIVICGINWFDVPVAKYLQQFNWNLWKYFGSVFSAKVWLFVSGIIVILFYIKKSVRDKPRLSVSDFYNKIKNSYAFWVFCSVFVASFFGAILKFLIGRARPVTYGMYGLRGFVPFTYSDVYHSMPSGHTLASFAGLVMIGIVWPRSRWFMWSLAILIGISRVCVGAHWPSDVILGAFVGVLAALLTKTWFMRRGK